MEVVYLICAAILFFIGGSLVLKQKKSAADHIAIAWIILELLTQLSYYLLETGGYASNIRFFQVIFGTHLLHAPLLYFYVVALLNKNFVFSWKSIVHLSPIIIFYLMHTPEFAKGVGLTTCANHFGCYYLNKPCSLVFNFSKLLLNTFYITFTLFTYRELVKSKERIGAQERVDRQWAKVLIAAAFTLNALIVFIRLFEVSQIQIFSSKLFVINIVATSFVLVFSFLGVNFRNFSNSLSFIWHLIKGMRIKENVVYECITEVISVPHSEGFEPCSIPDELMDKYEQALRNSMEVGRVYLEHQLTKSDLSKKLKIPEHHLGMVLKVRFGLSFNDFVNSYRLSDLLQKLTDSTNDNYTLLGLAYDCGFNSKSTFNRFFKSRMGITPSEWMRNSGKNIETATVS